MVKAQISNAKVIDGAVEVTWSDGAAKSRFPFFWLKDHCHSAEGLHPETRQRQVDTFTIPADIAPAQLAVEEDGQLLRIQWRNGDGSSELPAGFLKEIAVTQGRERAPAYALWDRATFGNALPGVPYDEVMDDARGGLRRWLETIERYGFGLVRGVPATPEATQALAERVGYIRQTIFGGFWDFTANLAYKDTAYTPVAIGPHTDGTYSFDPPGYQMFHCLQFDGSGGESTLVDGFKAADMLRANDPKAFEILTEVAVPAHYIGDGVHLRAEHPVIGLDANGGYRQIAYNNYDRAPFLLPNGRMGEFYRALGQFNRLVNDPALELEFRLEPGTVLLFDNWRCLHGRRAYQGYRRLCGAYLNKEDVESKLRLLRAAG
ncbi:MAG: trimethyllysine dioxygenase [Kiloniellales bacterium]